MPPFKENEGDEDNLTSKDTFQTRGRQETPALPLCHRKLRRSVGENMIRYYKGCVCHPFMIPHQRNVCDSLPKLNCPKNIIWQRDLSRSTV